MLADLGRIDIFFRTGLFALMRRRNWAPMLGGVQSVFVREIKLWQRFDVVSSIETWEGTQVIGRHHFVLENGEIGGAGDDHRRHLRPLGKAFCRDGRGDRGARHRSRTPRPPSEAEKAFMASHAGLRALAKGGREPVSTFYERLSKGGVDVDWKKSFERIAGTMMGPIFDLLRYETLYSPWEF